MSFYGEKEKSLVSAVRDMWLPHFIFCFTTSNLSNFSKRSFRIKYFFSLLLLFKV